MSDYGKKKSSWLITLRTLHSRAVTDSKDWIWNQRPYGLAQEYPEHTEEEYAEMKADLEAVIAILDKYKKVGR